MKSKSILLLACGLLFTGSTALALDLPTGSVTSQIVVTTFETLTGTSAQPSLTIKRGGFLVDGGALEVSQLKVESGFPSRFAAFEVRNGGMLTLGDGADIAIPLDGITTGYPVMASGDGSRICVSGSAKALGVSVADGAELVLAGAFAGAVSVAAPVATNAAFCVIGADVTEAEAAAACAHFTNVADANLRAAVEDGALVWRAPEPVPEHPEVDPSVAVASLADANGTRYYGSVEDAFAVETAGSVTVTLMKDAELLKSCAAQADVVLDGNGHTLTRPGTAQLAVTNLSLTVTNVVLTGGTSRLIDVMGGALTLEAGTVVRDISGSGAEMVAPIVVWGGTFTMNDGVEIRACTNGYRRPNGGPLAAGGVVVASCKDATGAIVEAKAFLNGGTVTGCSGASAGGIYIGNKARVSVQGDLFLAGNRNLKSAPCNLVVHDLSALDLVGTVTHGKKTIGFTEGILANTNEFGVVTASLSDDEIVTAARNFFHDTNGDIGAAVRGSGKTLLVWNSAISTDGTYVNDDGTYTVVSGGEDLVTTVPSAVAGLVYTGKEQAGVPKGLPYEVTGETATTAGSYTATVRLRPGYVWDDGTKADKTVVWTIARATHDMSGVTFEDRQFPYNMTTPRSLSVAGTLPAGVTVTYTGNGQVGPGTFPVTATFTVDETNYEPIEPMTAKMYIGVDPDPGPGPDPDPDPDPTPVICQPFAFTAIVEQADGSWKLTLAPGTAYCIYTLQTSDDLATWSEVGDPLTLTPDAAFEFVVPGGEAKRFWKVIGADGVAPAGN